MTNYQTGHDAEKQAAGFLVKHGFKILEMNWKTPRCEIDIIAEKDRCAYLVEIKYRRNKSQGSGLEYITPKKLKQMVFAARIWVQENDWQDEYQLAAIGIDGEEITFVDEIID